MDEYILMLVLSHLTAESPGVSYFLSELWSALNKDESGLVSVTSRGDKITERLV